MACGDQNYWINQQLAEQKPSEPEHFVGMEESFGAGGPFPVEEGQALKWSGDGADGKWVHFTPTPEYVAETIVGRKVTRKDGSGFIAEDCTELGACSEIFVDGKPYLMIDNSGPEELNPHKLQEENVELHRELSEAYKRIQSMEDNYPMGAKTNPVDTAKEAEKIIESNMMTFGEMADSIVYGPYGGGEYVASEGYSFSGYSGTPTPMIDMSGWDANTEVVGDCKLVSAEEADYERAMSMVGK